MFKTQLVINIIRSEGNATFDSILSGINKERKKNNKKSLTKEQAISILYSKFEYVEKIYKSLSKDKKKDLDHQLDLQMAPYKNINVCDAQVFVRPALYRKIRIGLGEWSIDPDETGYSDEIAYEILETDASWMSDPKKAEIVSKF
jgi:sulfatase maturation enzyme AslB (radical SAM superfamily)